jgi:hypothetical protein
VGIIVEKGINKKFTDEMQGRGRGWRREGVAFSMDAQHFYNVISMLIQCLFRGPGSVLPILAIGFPYL